MPGLSSCKTSAVGEEQIESGKIWILYIQYFTSETVQNAFVIENGFKEKSSIS
jgi:hypothetical protein